MPRIAPAFVPKDSTSIYRVWVRGNPEAFEAPIFPLGPFSEGGEAVHPFWDRSGGYTVMMYALSPEHCRYYEALRRGAAILEAKADRVYYTIFTHSREDKDHQAALIMMAWYLADDDASIMRLPDCDEVSFNMTDVAVWAAVAFVRNMWALHSYLSKEAFHRYLSCYYELVLVLRLRGVRLHTRDHPKE